MVIDDFLPVLRDQTGYAGNVAFLGWSMGGYGSLLLASQLGPARSRRSSRRALRCGLRPGTARPGAFDDAGGLRGP